MYGDCHGHACRAICGSSVPMATPPPGGERGYETPCVGGLAVGTLGMPVHATHRKPGITVSYTLIPGVGIGRGKSFPPTPLLVTSSREHRPGGPAYPHVERCLPTGWLMNHPNALASPPPNNFNLLPQHSLCPPSVCEGMERWAKPLTTLLASAPPPPPGAAGGAPQNPRRSKAALRGTGPNARSRTLRFK